MDKAMNVLVGGCLATGLFVFGGMFATVSLDLYGWVALGGFGLTFLIAGFMATYAAGRKKGKK